MSSSSSDEDDDFVRPPKKERKKKEVQKVVTDFFKKTEGNSYAAITPVCLPGTSRQERSTVPTPVVMGKRGKPLSMTPNAIAARKWYQGHPIKVKANSKKQNAKKDPIKEKERKRQNYLTRDKVAQNTKKKEQYAKDPTKFKEKARRSMQKLRDREKGGPKKMCSYPDCGKGYTSRCHLYQHIKRRHVLVPLTEHDMRSCRPSSRVIIPYLSPKNSQEMEAHRLTINLRAKHFDIYTQHLSTKFNDRWIYIVAFVQEAFIQHIPRDLPGEALLAWFRDNLDDKEMTVGYYVGVSDYNRQHSYHTNNIGKFGSAIFKSILNRDRAFLLHTTHITGGSREENMIRAKKLEAFIQLFGDLQKDVKMPGLRFKMANGKVENGNARNLLTEQERKDAWELALKKDVSLLCLHPCEEESHNRDDRLWNARLHVEPAFVKEIRYPELEFHDDSGDDDEEGEDESEEDDDNDDEGAGYHDQSEGQNRDNTDDGPAPGPTGVLVPMVSGSGDIKLTKDGNILLHEMQIQHPTASLIAKASTAHDDVVGDGTTSIVLLIGEIMKQADAIIAGGVHPRIISDGLNIAKVEALQVLEEMKLPMGLDRDGLINVARTALRTKVHHKLADLLAIICTDAALGILEEDGKTIDLHMIEMIDMQHKDEYDVMCLIKGLVLDHGGRHPDMSKGLKNCYIPTFNVALEYEKSEVNSGFFYKTAEEREKLLASEREFIDIRVQKLIDLKRQMCPKDNDKTFVLINQKGIDPISLDTLAKEGILALRRAKRRNMERLALACGGMAMNSFDDLSPECLGYAGSVYERVLGENKFTFVEECKNPKSVTIFLKGPTKHGIVQMKDAIRDGIRSFFNTIQVGCVIPGEGAFEIAIAKMLNSLKISSRAVLGVNVIAQAIQVIPKTLVTNAGHDTQEVLLKAMHPQGDNFVSVDLDKGDTLLPTQSGIFDLYAAKRQTIDAKVSRLSPTFSLVMKS